MAERFRPFERQKETDWSLPKPIAYLLKTSRFAFTEFFKPLTVPAQWLLGTSKPKDPENPKP